uniref:PLD phosphodiesterase domain-containing protein n=1 Tax=Glossina austeni TaxID=7395 RepID=A0A1A9UKB8_GLOAU
MEGVKSNNINILTNSDEMMHTVIKDINLAQTNIEMVFYIWHPGGWANQVAEVLIRAANRGIKCRLILDSAGSSNFFRSIHVKMMRGAGIKIVKALHVNILRIFFRRMDLRQHRKMILIDNRIGYTGSMNMIDPKYFKKHSGVGQWIDIMIRVEGPVVSAMRIIFSCDWEVETGEKIFFLPDQIKIVNEEKYNYTTNIIPSGPGFSEDLIQQVLLTAIYSARKKIVITTPYLVPSDDLLRAICTAAQRGVLVYIIIPKFNDSILVRWASRAFFSELLHSGVKIYQFENGLLHSKSILVDNQLSLVVLSMSEALKIFNNIRSLRAQARECTLETLEEILEKLEVVVNERREEDNQAQAEIEERTRKLKQYREMLIADGIDPNELLQSHNTVKASTKNKRAMRPAKYQYIDEHGESKTWTGQGRTPTIIKKAIDTGKKLEDFLL